MSKGVARDMRTRAQEALDKQERVVERLRTKVGELDTMLRSARVDLHNEEEILKYYQGHPALNEDQVMDAGQDQPTLMDVEAR